MRYWQPAAAAAIAVVFSVGAAPEDKAQRTIVMIPKGTTQVFWKTVHAGAIKAAQEEGVTLIWDAPTKENDRLAQIQLVQTYISRGVDAIVLVPQDKTALAPIVHAAKEKRIEVVIVNSPVAGDAGGDFISFIGTDNYNAGKLGGKRMAQVLKGKGKVALLRFYEGSESTLQREQGYLDGITQGAKDIEIVSSNQYAGVGVDKAFAAAQNLLNQYPDLDGIMCSNESTCQGVLRALETSQRVGRVKTVMFDASDMQKEALKNGHVDSLVVQNPFNQGYYGIKIAVAGLRGKPYEKSIDTGVILVTRENFDDPVVREWTSPDIKKYLGE